MYFSQFTNISPSLSFDFSFCHEKVSYFYTNFINYIFNCIWVWLLIRKLFSISRLQKNSCVFFKYSYGLIFQFIFVYSTKDRSNFIFCQTAIQLSQNHLLRGPSIPQDLRCHLHHTLTRLQHAFMDFLLFTGLSISALLSH